ncbi:hypothetical protein SISSUDRAFT_502476 [Sistotremastrum suecicum HHB10207 ss-3]|uniref:Uncharacterized protein n=1 Tax=Sistotremastrum suecicum HHB10207 ss-3 TaxID=1314776 RepID=A0A166IKD4_9AGAM|nr:hypothetical protein SISSUDRAFT_502476 [Sistotremastrum suecicum HHB10207 ss-3]
MSDVSSHHAPYIYSSSAPEALNSPPCNRQCLPQQTLLLLPTKPWPTHPAIRAISTTGSASEIEHPSLVSTVACPNACATDSDRLVVDVFNSGFRVYVHLKSTTLLLLHAQEENLRLRRRIAELERVIRELQKKPHPRWASSGLPTDLSLSFLDKDDLVSDSESDSSNRITLTLPSYRSSTSSPPSSATTPLPSSGCTTPLETMMDHPSPISKGLSTQFPFPVMSSSLDMSGLPLADQGMEQLLWAMMKNTQTAPFDVDMNMFDMASYDNALFDNPAIMRSNRPVPHNQAASQRGRIH